MKRCQRCSEQLVESAVKESSPRKPLNLLLFLYACDDCRRPEELPGRHTAKCGLLHFEGNAASSRSGYEEETSTQICESLSMARMAPRIAILRGLERLPTEIQQKIFSQLGLPSKEDIKAILTLQTPWMPLAFSPIDELLIAFVHDGFETVWFLNLNSHLELGVRLRGCCFHLVCKAIKSHHGTFLKVWKLHEWTHVSTQPVERCSPLPRRNSQPDLSTVSCCHCKCVIHCPEDSLDPWMLQCPDCLRMYGV